MAKNVRLKSTRNDSIQSLIKPTPAVSKQPQAGSKRDLKKEARNNASRIVTLEMVLAAKSGRPTLQRRPYHRQELERRRSAALIMQAIMLFVLLAAAVGWMNQRFHFWGE